MHRIIFTGFHHRLTNQTAQEFLDHIHAGPVVHFTVISDGNAEHPYLIAELDITAMQAFELTTRIKNYFYDFHHVSACALWAPH